jgi:hypothetical protein
VAPLCAEVFAAQLEDEPLPVERELAAAISPRRSLKSSRQRARI